MHNQPQAFMYNQPQMLVYTNAGMTTSSQHFAPDTYADHRGRGLVRAPYSNLSVCNLSSLILFDQNLIYFAPFSLMICSWIRFVSTIHCLTYRTRCSCPTQPRGLTSSVQELDRLNLNMRCIPNLSRWYIPNLSRWYIPSLNRWDILTQKWRRGSNMSRPLCILAVQDRRYKRHTQMPMYVANLWSVSPWSLWSESNPFCLIDFTLANH